MFCGLHGVRAELYMIQRKTDSRAAHAAPLLSVVLILYPLEENVNYFLKIKIFFDKMVIRKK